MSKYEIEKLAENSWGLFDREGKTPNEAIVCCHDKDLLEKIKADFIQSDKAEAKKKRKPKK